MVNTRLILLSWTSLRETYTRAPHARETQRKCRRTATLRSLPALRTVTTEHAGLAALQDALAGGLGRRSQKRSRGSPSSRGASVVTGVGKSGHIANKLAATFASTGTPSFFVHPSEANHGDLGMIDRSDAVLAISWSGETIELKGILAYTRRFSIPLVAITAGELSAGAGGRRGARAAACGGSMPAGPRTDDLDPCCSCRSATRSPSPCSRLGASPPTISGPITPGGHLGANLTVIRDVMHGDDRMPLVRLGTSMRDAILEIRARASAASGSSVPTIA